MYHEIIHFWLKLGYSVHAQFLEVKSFTDDKFENAVRAITRLRADKAQLKQSNEQLECEIECLKHERSRADPRALVQYYEQKAADAGIVGTLPPFI